MKKKVLFLIPALVGMLLTACGGGGGSSTPSDNPGGESETRGYPAKTDFTDVEFASASYVYDGQPHILGEVTGAPENTTITYTGRSEQTNVGTYNASAELVKEGYNDKTLNATLTITPATFTGYTYESKSVKYDGAEHINDIQLVGILPQGTTTTETVKNSNNETVTSAIEVGTYTYTCVVSNSNYNTLTLNATLTIKAKKKDMPVFVSDDGTVYFANGLHNSYLYSLSSGELKLIDYSSPKEFNKYSSS